MFSVSQVWSALTHVHTHASTTGQTATDHHSNANDHANTNDPTANQKAALAGTGTPSATDKYVSDSDARNTNARTPSAHASTHTTGADKIATGTPTGLLFLRDDFAWTAPTATAAVLVGPQNLVSTVEVIAANTYVHVGRQLEIAATGSIEIPATSTLEITA